MATRSVLLLAALGMATVVPLLWSMSGPARSADARFDGVTPVWSFRPLGIGEIPATPQRRLQARSRATHPESAIRRPPGRSRSSIQRGYRTPLLNDPARAGARKAVPITRGTELGFKFRPDEREAPYGLAGSGSGVPGVLPSPDLQSQFRPTQPRRKPTYEELEARKRPQAESPPLRPLMPYPPGALSPFPGYWNRW